MTFPFARYNVGGIPKLAASFAASGTNAANNLSIRNKCGVLTVGGTQIRVTFKAGSGGAYKTNHCSVGIWNGSNADTAATPVELLFSGVSGFNISSLATITSDWATLQTNTGNVLVVVTDTDATTANNAINTPGTTSTGRNYFSAGATYNSAAPGAGTGTDGQIDGVLSVEVRL